MLRRAYTYTFVDALPKVKILPRTMRFTGFIILDPRDARFVLCPVLQSSKSHWKNSPNLVSSAVSQVSTTGVQAVKMIYEIETACTNLYAQRSACLLNLWSNVDWIVVIHYESSCRSALELDPVSPMTAQLAALASIALCADPGNREVWYDKFIG